MNNFKNYKHLIFSNELTPQTVEEFLSKFNNEKYYLYFESKGGENASCEYLTNFLNFNKDNVILYTGNFIFSNGFQLVYDFKGEKIIGESTIGMIHLSSFEVEYINLKNKSSYEYVSSKDLLQYNELLIYKYSQFLNKSELKELKKGNDIYLSNKKLKEIFGIKY